MYFPAAINGTASRVFCAIHTLSDVTMRLCNVPTLHSNAYSNNWHEARLASDCHMTRLYSTPRDRVGTELPNDTKEGRCGRDVALLTKR